MIIYFALNKCAAVFFQVFIDHILNKTGYRQVFSTVYTNPAEFQDDGCLTLQPFHHQDWCQLSSVNMCKGHILEDHISAAGAKAGSHSSPYDLVVFVGDGSNDLCPSLRLRENDLVFARRGFKLANKLTDAENGTKPTARVVLWDSGLDIMNKIKETLSQLSTSRS